MDIKQQTNNVASQGRYGDTMLMHVNPAEVQGLASIMPLTQNPQTGQPEAFLPFLAPLLGSMAGTALFTGLSAPVAGAIGSGIATAIQSGDLKQGIMSGITGFGLGKALGAAGFGAEGRAAEALTTAGETGAAANLVTGEGVKQALAAEAAVAPAQAAAEAAATQTLGEGVSTFASQLAKPSSYLPIAMGEGQKGVIEAQENFERQMAQMELDRKKAREKMYADNPENIPMSSRYYGASGGIMSLAEGGPIGGVTIMDEVPKIPPRKLPPRLPRNVIPDNSFESAMAGLQDYKYKPRESKEPVRQAYEKMQVNELTGTEMPTGQFVPASDYRAGIDPEFNYFPRSNTPATYLGDYLDGIGGGGYGGGGYGGGPGGGAGYIPFDRFDYDRFDIDNIPFDYDRFINPINFPMGVTQNSFLPKESILNNISNTTIPNSVPVPVPVSLSEPLTQDSRGGSFMFKIRDAIEQNPDIVRQGGGFLGKRFDEIPLEDRGFGPGIRRSEDFFRPEELMMPPVIPTPPPTQNSGIGGARTFDNFKKFIAQNPDKTKQGEGILGGVDLTGESLRKAYDEGRGVLQRPPLEDLMMPPVMQESMPIVPPMPLTLRNDLGLASINRPEELNVNRQRMPMRMSEGKQLPNEGLEALAQTEKGKEAVRQMGFELQMGGLTPSNEEIQQVAQAIMGQSSNQDAVISMFIEKYGNEIFMQVREMILNPQGNAQTQGMIEGEGSGMDDEVMGMIGNQRPVAVSPGEYIVPADVVSGLGDGSSDSGAEELDGMLDRVRKERTGTTKQAPQLSNAGGLLPK